VSAGYFRRPDISRPSVIFPGEFLEIATELIVHAVYGGFAKVGG
jgi:hypothetical protein